MEDEQEICQQIDNQLAGHWKDAMPWRDIVYEIGCLRNKKGNGFVESNFLIPYYKRFLQAEDCFFCGEEGGRYARTAIIQLMRHDNFGFASKLNEIDLVGCAHNWSKRQNKDKHIEHDFALILTHLFENGYVPPFNAVYKETCSRLGKSHEFGNYKELELYCLVIAFLLVSHADIAEKEKNEFYEQIFQHWNFLRYMYSFMLKHIIGINVKNFAGLAGTLVNSKTYYPFMHLAYKAFKENFDLLCPDDGEIDYFTREPVRKQATRHLKTMENLIKKTPADNSIIPLLELLFPKKIKDVLEQERPKTYAELEQDIAQMNNTYECMVKKLAECVSTSLSMEEIETAFAQFNADLALSFYSTLNNLLTQNETWCKYSPQIQRHILERQKKEKSELAELVRNVINKPSTVNNTFEKGSCHFGAGSSMNGNIIKE